MPGGRWQRGGSCEARPGTWETLDLTGFIAVGLLRVFSNPLFCDSPTGMLYPVVQSHFYIELTETLMFLI